MSQFGEKSLSCPRGPACCVSTRKPSPMNIQFQPAAVRMIMLGSVDARGFMLVPEACSISDMPALFMLRMASDWANNEEIEQRTKRARVSKDINIFAKKHARPNKEVDGTKKTGRGMVMSVKQQQGGRQKITVLGKLL